MKYLIALKNKFCFYTCNYIIRPHSCTWYNWEYRAWYRVKTHEHEQCEFRAKIKIWAFGVFRQIKGWARQGRQWINRVRPGHTHTHAHSHTHYFNTLVLSRCITLKVRITRRAHIEFLFSAICWHVGVHFLWKRIFLKLNMYLASCLCAPLYPVTALSSLKHDSHVIISDHPLLMFVRCNIWTCLCCSSIITWKNTQA